MNGDVCLIFAGGPVEHPEKLSVLPEGFVICADGGYELAVSCKKKPDVVLGDFDSLDSMKVPPDALLFPKEKDDTDMMIAVKLALSKGYRHIVMYGALGGRLDHTLANIQTMRYILTHGGTAEIQGEQESLYLLENGSRRFEKREGYYFSVLSASYESSGVCLLGVKYPLQDAVLSCDFPLGISNEITEDFCEVSVKQGILLILYAKSDTPKISG